MKKRKQSVWPSLGTRKAKIKVNESTSTKRLASTTRTTAHREQWTRQVTCSAHGQIIPYLETKMRPRDNAGSHAEAT